MLKIKENMNASHSSRSQEGKKEWDDLEQSGPERRKKYGFYFNRRKRVYATTHLFH